MSDIDAKCDTHTERERERVDWLDWHYVIDLLMLVGDWIVACDDLHG
jgi:hypothetical protein